MSSPGTSDPSPNTSRSSFDVTLLDQKGLVFSKEGKIDAATLDALINQLVTSTDGNYLHQFMLTFRSFTTPHELLTRLIEKFHTPSSLAESSLNNNQSPEAEKTHKVMRFKILNVMKQWVDKYRLDFDEDESLLEALKSFTKEQSSDFSVQTPVDQISKLIHRDDRSLKKKNFSFSGKPPVPYLMPYQEKKDESKMKSMSSEMQGFLDYHPIEIARQLTLSEEALYHEIRLSEFFGQAWMKKEKENNAKNILAFINKFNQVSTWITSLVLSDEDCKNRAKIIGHALKVAQACLDLNNYNGCMEVLAGLSSASVSRLKQTWTQVKEKELKLFNEMNMLMDSNFKNLRIGLSTAQPPCIPYLGIFLSDLTFIDEGNPDYLPNGLIFFSKFRQTATVLQTIQQFQYAPYCLQHVEPITRFIEQSMEVYNWSEVESYKKSQLLEARAKRSTQFSESIIPDDQIAFFEKRANIRGLSDLSVNGVGSDVYDYLVNSEGYHYSEKDASNNVILSDVKTLPPVTAGTLAKIVEHATSHKFVEYDHKIKCVDCGQRILGIRNKCVECKNVDQCDSCVLKPLHPVSHVYLKLPAYYMNQDQLDNQIKALMPFEFLGGMDQNHNGVICQGCGQNPIKGVRYFNLVTGVNTCLACEKIRTSVDALSMPCLRIQKPLSEKTKFSTGPHLDLIHPHMERERRFAETLLLTYRRFTTASEFLNLLILRYSTSQVWIDAPDQMDLFKKQVEKPLRLRVLRIMQMWIEKYWESDFSAEIRKTISDFLTMSATSGNDADISRMIDITLKMIGDKNQPEGSISPRKHKRHAIIPNPNKLKPESVKLLECSPKDIAEQLTLLEFPMLKNVTPVSILNFIQVELDTAQAQQINNILTRGYQTSRWIATEILKETNLEAMISVICHFISIAKHCQDVSNLNTMKEIVAAMDMPCIRNLEPVWKPMIPPLLQEQLDDMRESEYRLSSDVKHAWLPSLKGLIEGLAETQESYPDSIRGLINFEKYHVLAEEILMATELGANGYNFTPNSSIRAMILQALEDALDEDALNKMSSAISKANQKILSMVAPSSSPPQRKASLFGRLKRTVSSSDKKETKMATSPRKE